jgi:uncharacterized protein (DUF2461 family)
MRSTWAENNSLIESGKRPMTIYYVIRDKDSIRVGNGPLVRYHKKVYKVVDYKWYRTGSFYVHLTLEGCPSGIITETKVKYLRLIPAKV